MVGIGLVKWVLDDAPADLPLLDRLALLALAEWARDETGECWPGRPAIAGRLRRSESTVDRALRSLIRRGLVEIVRPAAPGQTTVYRLIVRHQVTHDGKATCVISGVNVRHFRAERASPGDAQNPQEPSGTLKDQGARADEITAVITELRSRTGKTIDEDHAARVIEQLLGERPGVKDRIRYLIGIMRRDDNPRRFLPTPSPPRYRPEDHQ